MRPIWDLLNEGGIKPWLKKGGAILEFTPSFPAKIKDVLEIYQPPFNPKEPVVYLDDTPVCFHVNLRESIASEKPGEIFLKRDYKYKRNGTAIAIT